MKAPADSDIDTLITELYTSLLLGDRALWTTLHTLIQSLPAYDQKGFLDTILRDLARRYFSSSVGAIPEKESLLGNTSVVGGVAALIAGLVEHNPLLKSQLVHWITATNGEYAAEGLDVRRAVIATIATNQGICSSVALFSHS